jgi:hypothetical protein
MHQRFHSVMVTQGACTLNVRYWLPQSTVRSSNLTWHSGRNEVLDCQLRLPIEPVRHQRAALTGAVIDAGDAR